MPIEAHATAAGAGHPPQDAENVFVVCRRDGSLPVGASHPLGLYRDDCRFLSGHELCVNRVRPRLLISSAVLATGGLSPQALKG